MSAADLEERSQRTVAAFILKGLQLCKKNSTRKTKLHWITNKKKALNVTVVTSGFTMILLNANSEANQVRILGETSVRFSTWTGSG